MKEEVDFLIIANFMAGGGEARTILSDLKTFLANHDLTYDLLVVDKPARISLLPKNGCVIKKGVICLGGDGTVSETIGYVLNHQLDLPVALIPTGTANIIAGTLGLIRKEKKFDFLLGKNFKKVDIGVAEYNEEKDYFVLGLGLGFEEKFLKLTKEKFKKNIGVFSYIFAALMKLFSLPKIPVVIYCSERQIKATVCLMTVLNVRPKVLNLFPLFEGGEIKLDDGLFNLYYVEHQGFLKSVLGILFFHVFGKLNFGLVKSFAGREFTLESSGICGTQLDGELRSCLPVKVYFHKEPCRFFGL